VAVRKILILVESNTTGTGREFARRAGDLGAEPVLITTDPARYGYVAADGVRYVIADTSSDAELLATTRRLAANSEVAGVTSSSDYFILAAALLARAWRMSGPSPEAVRNCQHKGRQRQILAAAGLPGPRYAIAVTESDALASARGIGFPIVMKPVRGSGSFGVRLCKTEREVLEHARSVLARTVNERNIKIASGVVVEEYIDAEEFSVETFHGKAIAIIRKHLGSLPHFVEIGHDIPSGLSSADEAVLESYAMKAVKALGLEWGASHVEVRMRDGEVAIIEVNARLAGGMIPELVRHARGIDLVGSQVTAALGRDAQVAGVGKARAGSIRFLVSERGGILRSAERAVARISSVQGAADVAMYKSAGEHVTPAVDFRGRLGHVMTVSDDADTAAHSAEQCLEALRSQLLDLR
jgi:S-sulfo-L-cysteine synthase (3-phospho-L-serine-dependent)